MSDLKIALISSEIEPFAKTGGLADMVGSFSQALAKLGRHVDLFLPNYPCIPANFLGGGLGGLHISAGGQAFDVQILRGQNHGTAGLYLFDIPGLFDRPGLYGESGADYPDNCLRFTVFCRAVLEWLRRSKKAYDILHCHDWQTALVPIYLKTLFSEEPFFAPSRCLLSLHNLAYQGIFPASDFSILGLPPGYLHPAFLEFFQKLNLLKGGILAADALSTVSPSYAKEILGSELGFGMEGVLGERQDSLVGILNGIDEEEWNPETNPALPCPFSAKSLHGKADCKAALQREFALPQRSDLPLFGTISRLVDQKGIDLLLEAIADISSLEFQWVVLGQGEERFETGLRELSRRFPERVAASIRYDRGLAQRITAGADFLAMPSRFEPCGYNQLYALRYGTLPIVHGVGGLNDSVRDWRRHPDGGTGIVLEEASVAAVREGLSQAAEIFGRKDVFAAMRRRAMNADFTWKYSAQQYLELYERMLQTPSSKIIL